jgi:mRNA interferase MazF
LKELRPKTTIPRSSGDRPPATKSGDSYCPDAGDFIWIDFDPIKGHEQSGNRPAIVLSPHAYNVRAGLCLACPITNRAKGFRFEVPIPAGGTVTGVVLADQVRSLSWIKRRAKFGALAPVAVLDDVRAKIAALIEIE